MRDIFGWYDFLCENEILQLKGAWQAVRSGCLIIKVM